MPSWRNFRKFAYQCGLYEAQDVFQSVDDVDLICPTPGRRFPLTEGLHKWLMWRDISRMLAAANPGLKPFRLERDYELLIVVCQSWWDLFFINAIRQWRERSAVAVCLIDELWAAAIPQYKYWLHALNKFDHVFLGFKDSVSALQNVIDCPCHWLPGAVDALRFSPYPHPPERVVDIYSMGRRLEAIHRSTLKAAAENQLFYLYDSVPGSTARPPDHQEHRGLIANIAKRSRCFAVGPAKLGAEADTQGQIEIGYRFFEGAAAGTVMVGQAPACSSFRELFGWPDAVIHLETDGSNVDEVLARFTQESEEFQRVSRRNAREALLRHDWAYRWRKILEVVGLAPAPALEKREHTLKELAEMTYTDHLKAVSSNTKSAL
jgi:hypothetical protein